MKEVEAVRARVTLTALAEGGEEAEEDPTKQPTGQDTGSQAPKAGRRIAAVDPR